MLSESAQETISGILEEAHIVASMNDDSEEMERIKVAIADLEAERTALQAGPVPVDWQAIAQNHTFIELRETESGKIYLMFKEGRGTRGITTHDAYEQLQSIVYGLLQAQQECGDDTLQPRPATGAQEGGDE